MKAVGAGANNGVRGRGLRAGLVLGTLLFLGAGLVLPQPPAEPAKQKSAILPIDSSQPEPGKEKLLKPISKAGDAAKDKLPKSPDPKTGDTAKDTVPKSADPKAAKPAGLAKSNGKEPGTVVISAEQFQEHFARTERVLPNLCKLMGELGDGAVVLQAEYMVRTEKPNVIVPLGLQEGFLFDPEGKDQEMLAEKELHLKVEDDGGFFLEVPRQGTYRWKLHVKVPVQRRAGDGSGGDRGIRLGLPGSATTELSLTLPDSIKEFRWSNPRKDDKKEDKYVEKNRQDGRWLPIGSGKMLDLVWKEPVVLPGSGPLLVVKNDITVKLEETMSWIEAEMQVEDKRGQAREYQLLLPLHTAEVKVVKAPPGVVHEVLSPPADSKNQIHSVRFSEPVSGFSVRVDVRQPRRRTSSLPVGPFFVYNAYSQQGTITVQASPAAIRGQWLSFQPADGTRLSRGPVGQDVKAVFDYWSAPVPLTKSAKSAEVKVPLQIEWRAERSTIETYVDHQLKLKPRPGNKGLQIDVTTQIRIKPTSQDYLDVHLPRPSLPRLGVLAGFAAAPYPAAVPWGGFFQHLAEEGPFAEPTGNFILEEETGPSPILLSAPDASGKAEIKNLSVNKELTLTLTGRYYVPVQHTAADGQHFRIELPRPLGTVDRGGKAPVVSADEQIELVLGPPRTWDSSYPYLDLSWRPYHPQFVVQNLADVTLRGKEAHLRQQLTFSWSASPGRESPRIGTVSLRLPRGIRNVKFVGGDLVSQSEDLAKVKLDGKELTVDFYQPLPEQADWKVPLAVPENATALEAKVRIWSEPGVQPEAVEAGDRWQDRGPELVPGRALPALVLHGAGRSLDLTLRLPAARASQLPAMVCDKGLIQVRVTEEGDHFYRAHYLIQKLYANPLDVEFPAPADSCILRITLNDVEVPFVRDRDDRNVAHLSIDPRIVRPLAQAAKSDALLLIIEYKLPANFAENDSRWQTQLRGPVFRGDVFLGRVRWLVSLPPSWVAFVAAGTVAPEVHWSLQSWLLAPEAVLPPGELEAWSAKQEDPVSLVFTRRNQDAIAVVHFPRQTWLLLCSALLLTIGLALHLLPLSRSFFWVILASLGLAVCAGGFLWPTWVPALLFGVQPGALVLGLILAVHWVLNERYRRQVVFMPGFTRLKPGSSLLHTAPVARRDPSTVDAPAPSGVQGRGGQEPLG